MQLGINMVIPEIDKPCLEASLRYCWLDLKSFVQFQVNRKYFVIYYAKLCLKGFAIRRFKDLKRRFKAIFSCSRTSLYQKISRRPTMVGDIFSLQTSYSSLAELETLSLHLIHIKKLKILLMCKITLINAEHFIVLLRFFCSNLDRSFQHFLTSCSTIGGHSNWL